MATATPTPSQSNEAPTQKPRQRQRWQKLRRNGGQNGFPNDGDTLDTFGPRIGQGTGGRAQPARDALLAMRPASVAPTSQPPSAEPSSADVSAAENKNSRRQQNRGGRGGNRQVVSGPESGGEAVQSLEGHGRRQIHGAGTRLNAGRHFGGQLTVNDGAEESGTSSSLLQGDAPEFCPGRPHTQQRAAPGKPKAATQGKIREPPHGPRDRRGSKSSAPDIATRTQEDIARGLYECPICTSEVGRHSKIWCCRTCWTVFHLSCIKKWSKNEGSTMAQQQAPNEDLPPPRQWRCPGCNLPKDALPTIYTCWCEKEVDPRPIPGLPPHSCGQTCGKPRLLPKKCPHPCELLCHAGPCPPCTHVGPTQSCFCGKQSATRRCMDTNYDNGWSCGQVCGDLMPCGEHTCERGCHEGLCGACEVRMEARCYCGKVEKDIICCERGEEKESKRADYGADGGSTVERWTGIFHCGSTCSRYFDCNKHHCGKRCHVQEAEQERCPRSPDLVSHCPCGKTPLHEISSQTRQSCEDPIPNCKKECFKWLPCGHPCRQVCHTGECMLCLKTVLITCRCGRTTSSTICHQGTDESPQCMRVCRVTLNCGRHECGERCCPGERKAAERHSSKRKLRPLGSTPRAIDEGFEAEHICTRLCGRMLKCGNHTCPELCHKGPCGSCREAIFDEISCNCGRTVLQPPLPCGTKPPPCRFECERHKSCGHPQIPHICHNDEESCPKCPFLIEKMCACRKKTLKNQQCWLPEVHCGEICGRKLKCGSHTCRKQCHQPGECEDKGRACQQACGKAKKTCGHPCEEQCHAPYPCREEKPCPLKLFVTCDCQHLKQEMKCNASRSSEGNNKKTLKCDEECARLERNRKLALALNIDPATHKDDHIPYSQDTLSMFKESTKWSQTQEREFRVFAMDDVEKRLRFKPMPPHQRAFLHALAEDYGLDSESMDPEPHRHVALFKSPRFVTAPNKTLQECVRIKHAAESSSLPTATETQTLRSSNFAKSSFNGYILAGTRFGLTLEDLHSSITSVLTSAAGIQFDISFLPSEEVVCKARNANLFMPLSDKDILNVLKNLQPTLAKIVSAKSLASTIQLCRLDDSLNVLHREMDGLSDTGGWSQVAAKAAVPMRVPRQMAVGGKSVYTVLGSRLAEAKKKKEEDEKRRRESVVDDWEEAELREEEKELGTAGTDADESHGIVEEHKVVVEMASGMNKEGLNASADSLIEQHGKPATVVVETDPAQEEAEETTSVMRHVQTLVAGSAEGNNNVVDTIPRLEFVPSPAEDPLHGNFTL